MVCRDSMVRERRDVWIILARAVSSSCISVSSSCAKHAETLRAEAEDKVCFLDRPSLRFSKGTRGMARALRRNDPSNLNLIMPFQNCHARSTCYHYGAPVLRRLIRQGWPCPPTRSGSPYKVQGIIYPMWLSSHLCFGLSNTSSPLNPELKRLLVHCRSCYARLCI